MLSANDKSSTTTSNGLTSNLYGGYTAQPRHELGKLATAYLDRDGAGRVGQNDGCKEPSG